MITVVQVAGLATIQDGGRPGHMHEGVPPGGPLVPESLARANAAAGNGPTAAAIELVGAITLMASDGCVVGCDDGSRASLTHGVPWKVTCLDKRVRYVAVRGGVDVPVVLGGRGTLLVAGFGGHEGRELRRGDVIHASTAPLHEGYLPPEPDFGAPLFIVPGPDLDRFEPRALDVLLSTPFVVDSRSDRTGIRLTGPPIPRADGDSGVSAPMIRGAVQVPPSGCPLVLGPDHPTTGGYPVLATVVHASLGTLGALPVGAVVRFERKP